MLQLVYAVSPTRSVEGQNELAFGLDDGLPWGHIKQDLQNFKARTKDTILIMGAKTFMSLPDVLPGRQHVVVQDLDRPYVQAKNGMFADWYTSMEEFENIINGCDGFAINVNKDSKRLFKDGTYSVIGGIDLIKKATHTPTELFKPLFVKSIELIQQCNSLMLLSGIHKKSQPDLSWLKLTGGLSTN